MKFDPKSSKNVKEYMGAGGAPTLVQLSPEECATLCKGAGCAYMDGFENRVLEYTLSDESADRDKELILQDGWDFDAFLTSPTVLGFHNGRSFPTARIIKLWIDPNAQVKIGKTMIVGKATKGWLLFPDERVDNFEESERFFRFAKFGFMTAGSVGFGAATARPPTPDEIEKYGQLYAVITKAELQEFSLCPVGSNRNALVKAVQDGHIKSSDAAFIADAVYGELMSEAQAKLENLFKEIGMQTKISKTHLEAVKAAHGLMDEAKDFHSKCMGKMADCQDKLKAIVDGAEPVDDDDEKELTAAAEKFLAKTA